MASSSAPNGERARNLVVIGASAGGVEALKQVVSRLPRDLPAAVCIVLHVAPTSTSALAGILTRAGDLPCRAARDGEILTEGQILVAPPDHHLLVEDGRVRLDVGPRENGHRPAVDALFRSAAQARGGGVVGVVLSGTRDDGAAGLAVIKANGGATVVQDPDDALYAGMPESAIGHVVIDAIGPSARLADAIAALVVGGQLPEGFRASAPPAPASRGSKAHLTLVCPECGGVLQERDDDPVSGWVCHVGHAYSPSALVDAQGAAVEAALWTALRSLEDRAALLRRMAERATRRHQPRSATLFDRRAEEAKAQADLLRGVVHDAAGAAQRSVTDETDEPLKAGEVA